MKTAIIIGATSGIGRQLAICLLEDGWRVGIAGRREHKLMEMKDLYGEDAVAVEQLDITLGAATSSLDTLLGKTGSPDLFCMLQESAETSLHSMRRENLKSSEPTARGWYGWLRTSWAMLKTTLHTRQGTRRALALSPPWPGRGEWVYHRRTRPPKNAVDLYRRPIPICKDASNPCQFF